MATNNAANFATGASGTVLTGNGVGVAPTFQAAGGGGITTINGDSGSITGSTVTFAEAYQNGSLRFRGISATQMVLDSSDDSQNTAYGLQSSTGVLGTSLGGFNTAMGASSLGLSNGSNNVAIGYNVFANGEFGGGTSNWNIALGSGTADNYVFSESSNIIMNAVGVSSESNTLRLGNATGTGNKELNKAVICGINGITVTGTAVLVSSANQLGVAVSSRIYKENIEPVESFESQKIYDLNPVTFFYKNDDTKILHYGLIAEDVKEVLPELVLYDQHGKLLTVEYHELPILMLAEIKNLRLELNELKERLAVS